MDAKLLLLGLAIAHSSAANNVHYGSRATVEITVACPAILKSRPDGIGWYRGTITANGNTLSSTRHSADGRQWEGTETYPAILDAAQRSTTGKNLKHVAGFDIFSLINNGWVGGSAGLDSAALDQLAMRVTCDGDCDQPGKAVLHITVTMPDDDSKNGCGVWASQ